VAAGGLIVALWACSPRLYGVAKHRYADAEVAMALGEHDAAHAALEDVLDARSRTDAVKVAILLTDVLALYGRGDWEAGLDRAQDALSLADELGMVEEFAPEAWMGIGHGSRELGRIEEALEAYRAADDAIVVRDGPQHLDRLSAAEQQAGMLARLERHGEAEEVLRDRLELAERVLDEGDLGLAEARRDLAANLSWRWRHREGLELLRAAEPVLAIYADPREHQVVLQMLVAVEEKQGEFDAALLDLERVDALDGSPALDAWVRSWRGDTLRGMDRLDEALDVHARAVRLAADAPGPHERHLSRALVDLALTQSRRGAGEEALVLLERADAAATRVEDVAVVARSRASVLVRLERGEEALELLAQLVPVEATGGPWASDRAELELLRARALVVLARGEEAEQAARQALRAYDELAGAQAWQTGHAWEALGRALTLQGRDEAALDAYQAAITRLRRAYGVQSATVALVRARLGRLMAAVDDPAGAPELRSALADLEARLGPEHPRVVEVRGWIDG